MEEAKYIIILCTCPSDEIANKIADSLLKEKLIACANIIPKIVSKYWWEGEIQTENEILLILKTKHILYSKVEKVIKSNHSYEVPEVISIEIKKGSKDYLDWINNNVLK